MIVHALPLQVAAPLAEGAGQARVHDVPHELAAEGVSHTPEQQVPPAHGALSARFVHAPASASG